MTVLTPVILSFALLPQGGGEQAAAQLRRSVPDARSIVVDVTRHRPDRLVVKLAEGSGAAARAAIEVAVQPRKISPYFAGLEAELGALRRRVLANSRPGEAVPADLSLYLELETRGLADSRALLSRLNGMAIVELAYPRELPTPPPSATVPLAFVPTPGDIPPVTPGFFGRQGYADPAPNGIDGGAIRSLTGAWGKDMTVLDIEWGWWFDHEDIQALRPSSLVGPPLSQTSFNNHGTAVSGELAADADEWGVTGLTPDIELLVTTNYPSTGYSVARAIVAAMTRLRSGDVMLLEAQARTSLGLGPTEWIQADFDAIQNATRAGVITVEAAGNGNVNLDDSRLGGRFDLNVRDSGAIIVGASDGVSTRRASFSSYGSRIDANGWGRNVVTTGYGNLFNPNGDRRQRYSASFSGTSSASPIVTSAVVALLGAAKAQLSAAEAAKFDYQRIRSLLRAHGTSIASIARRPDAKSMLRSADLERGLRILDRPQLGKTHRLRIESVLTPAANGWALLGSGATANVALPAPFAGPFCNRLLLDGSQMLALANGSFSGGQATVNVPVPTDSSLIGARYYWQAVTLHAATSRLCMTNSSMTYVERN